MALKPLAHKPPVPLPSAPAWGIIAPEGDTPSVLRLECGDRTESIPYHTLSRWTLHLGAEDTLTLWAGSFTATLRGRALSPVRDALEAGQLVCVRATPARYLPVRTGPVITDIRFSA